MKHESLISLDEAAFGFGTPKAVFEATSAAAGDAADFITVPDAHLLFSGEFKHVGNDLKIIGEDGKSFLVTDYFKTDKHPTLRSPEGATLNGDLVDLLAGPLAPGQYAQAGAQQGTAEAVGRVAVVTGNVTVIRNGVAITVNAGDVILKNDVVQTGAGATCGLALNDGSTFNISANARLAINEFVYDPNGSANSSLTTLIQGAATFVAGQIAKTGDMKVATPVATMGIRGTAVILDINAADGRVSISVIDQRDNQTHSVEVFDRAGNLIATATSIGGRLVLTPTATLEVIASFTNKTPDQVAAEFAAFQAVLSSYDAAKQFFPNLPDHTDANPKGTQHAQGTDIQPSQGGSKLLPDSPTFGDTIVVREVVITTPADPSGDGDDNGPDTDTNPNIFDDDDPEDQIIVTTITGTPGDDTLTGTPGNDIILAGPGNDTILAGHGGGDDRYDGGTDTDWIRFPSADALQPLVFHLHGFASQNTVDGPQTGHDIFTNIEKIESGDGNDTFHIYGNTNWHIDAGDGVDTAIVEGDLDITDETDGPDISHLEIIDLKETGSNTIDLDIEGALDMIEGNATGYLQIKGTDADQVKLTNSDDQNGQWRLAKESDCLEDGPGDGYVAYVFDNGGEIGAVVYIDADIATNIAPEVTLPPQTYLAFDGDDYAASSTPGSTQIDNVTIEGWIRWNGGGSGGQGQVLFYNGNTSSAGYGLFGEVVGDSLKILGLAGGQNVLVSDALIDAGEWHHLALVREDGTFHLYVDGVEASLTNADTTVNEIITEDDYGAPDHTMIGGNPLNANEGFHGDIADVRLWDTARTEQEIGDAQFGSFSGSEPGLVGYWPLNEGTGNSAPDHAAPASDLVFQGAPTWAAGLQINEDQTAKISGIQVVDPDAGDGQMHVTLSVAHGALALVDESDVVVQTDDDGNITISGTLVDINAALATGVLFIPDANYNGTDALSITVTDAHGGTSTREIAIALAPVDEAPAIDLDADDSSGVTGTGYQTTATLGGAAIAVLDGDASIALAEVTDTLQSAVIRLVGTGSEFTYYPDIVFGIDVSSLDGATGNSFSGLWHGISWQYSGGSSGLNINITGNGSAADYMQILQAARASFDTDIDNTGANVTITVTGDGGSASATTAVQFDAPPPPNEPPVANDDTLTGDLAGFTYNPANGHWYKASDVGDYKLWSDAQAAALAAGGYLATITSLAENQFVLDLLTNVQNVWIGGSDAGEEGVWRWMGGPENGQQFWQGGSNGVALLYANWHAEEPNDQNGEDFAILGPDGTWYDGASADWETDAWEYVVEVSFVEDHVSVIPGAFLLANDTDADGPTPSIYSVSVTDGTHGTVDLVDGNIVYTPDADYHGPVSFQYTVSDGTDVSAPATVNFNMNDAPDIDLDNVGTGDFLGEETTALYGLSITDTDAGEYPYFDVSFHAEHGQMIFFNDWATGTPGHDIEFNGTLTEVNNKIFAVIYGPPEGADPEVNLIDTVTMTADDGHGGTDTVNFIFNAIGPGGVSLTGTEQKDVLFGTGGDDTLEGGDHTDTFVFDHNAGDNGIGHDTVNDFVAGVDKIHLGEGFDSIPTDEFGQIDFAAWYNTDGAFEQSGDDTVIHLSGGEFGEDITLKNVLATSLTANDFLIYPGSQ